VTSPARSGSGTARAIGFVGLEQLVRMALALGVGTRVARELGPGAYGDLAFGIGLTALVLPLAIVGSDPVIMHRAAQTDGLDPLDARAAFAVRVRGSLLAIGAAAVVSVIVVGSGAPLATALLCAASLAAVPSDLAFLSAIARRRPARVIPVRVVLLVVAGAVRIAALAWGAGSVAIASIFLAETLVLSAVTWVIERPVLAHERARIAERALLRESAPLLANSVMFAISLRIDVVLVRTVLGAEELGVYSAAVRFSEVGMAAASVTVPTLASAIAAAHRAGSASFEAAYRSLLRRALIVGAVVGVLVVAIGLLAVGPLLGSAYDDARAVLMVHALSIVPIWIIAVRERYVVAMGTSRALVATGIVGVIVNVAANLVLLPTIGVVGAAWATVASYSAVAAWSLVTRRQRQAVSGLLVR
jgi:polysaccharide transporter, PST family